MTSPLTNTRSGSFHKLDLLNSNGDFQDLLSLISAGGGLSSAQASALITAALTSYTNAAALGVLLNGKVDVPYLASILATYTNTPTLTNLLAGKQPVLTSTIDVTCQDILVRNLTASATTFVLKGGALNHFQDNLANTIMEFQNSHIQMNRGVNFAQTCNFYTTVSLTNSAASLSGQLFVGAGNKLRWQGQDVVDVPALNGAVAVAMGTVPGTVGTAVNNAINAITPPIAQLVATPSGLSLGQSGATFAKHRIALYETVGSSHNFYGVGLHSGANFGTGIWTSTGGNYPYSDGSTQTGVPPDIFINVGSRFVGIGTTSPTQKLDVAGSITCLSVIQTSDKSIKENVTDTPLDDLQAIFDSSSVRTYTRTDGVEGKRFGFIAQEIQSQLPSDITNIVFETQVPTREGAEPGEILLALDYSRLASTVLWGVCKKQQQAIDALTNRLEVLEGQAKSSQKKPKQKPIA